MSLVLLSLWHNVRKDVKKKTIFCFSVILNRNIANGWRHYNGSQKKLCLTINNMNKDESAKLM